ncbi:MAG: GNAT family N-acetyltransferase [Planctomycetota bacterium]
MVIREFAVGDEPQLAQVYYQAVHQTAAADYSSEQCAVWAPAQRDPVQWAERIRGIRPFIAEIDGVISGYADVQANGYIDHFFVSPGAGRRGVGSALMRRIHEVAVARQIPRLFSHVSITAKPFFEKFGFIVDAAQVVVVSGISFDNFRMSKSIIP